MKKSIVAICMLTLMCLFSCDINFLNELLGKARDKFLEKNEAEKNLNSKEGNQEGKENQVDVSKFRKDVVTKRNLQEEKGIDIFQTKLTEDQESYLTAKDTEANEIKKKIDVNLAEINAIYDELKKSLSELENMKSDIISAKSDFEKARGSDGSSIDSGLKEKLFQAIEKIEGSKHIAVVGYKELFLELEHVLSHAGYAKNSSVSALGESEQVRSNGYYYIGYIVDNIYKAKTSLSDAENMFNEVKSKMDNFRDKMERVKIDFADLKGAHQVIQQALVVKK
ncbi:hypothetical protein bcCo53_001506 (plasmid) [Borrelia coriaceae]|uniref:hypothetical protein n=1 Tax=Borrelia coriaceae TaxID=144 RepID=UPI000486E403|nr:hypothetical protein [Borrelia coriaceae]UPA17323.1 hypothetical protein bcCo53_001506 [Borrelia coriaceae]